MPDSSSRPLVQYLTKIDGYQLTIAARQTSAKTAALIEGLPVLLDVNNDEHLSQLISAHDITISLLPYTLHPQVARLCLKNGKNLVTTSYVSPEMRAMDEQAKAKGLLFLNEIGLDPGIDHMSAMQIIDQVHSEGGKIREFYSICGGLPSPQHNNNPFGYKFSWSPRGVILAGRNAATYLRDCEAVTIPGPELFSHAQLWPVKELGEFEAYPNRNSLPYKDFYNIPEVKTLMRGTFRNLGWCETLKALADLNILDDTLQPHLQGKSYAEMMAELVHDEDPKAGVCRAPQPAL